MKTKLSFSCNTEPRTTQVSLNMMYYQEKILVLVQTSIALFWRRRLPARLERNIWQSSSSSSSWSDNCTRIWIMELGLGVSHWSPLFWNSHHLLFSHSFRCHYRPLQMASVLSIFRTTNWAQWLIRLKTQKKITGSKIGVIFWQITSRVTTKILKIRQRGPFQLGPFFSLFLIRKTLSSGQKWFLRPYFPLIRGMLVVQKWG